MSISAAHPPRRQIGHRHHRPDPGPGPHGPARLLGMVEGRSKQVFKTWLSERDETRRTGVEVVAMGGFTGFKTAAIEELKDDVTVVMDPFHVVRLAGQSLELCRRRVQQQMLDTRGRAGDALYSVRRTLSTGADLLKDMQRQRTSTLFADEKHLQVEAMWGVYQAMVAAYRDPDRTAGKGEMQKLIDTLGAAVPGALVKVRTLGRLLEQRSTDVLAYFDRPGTGNGPTEAINGRLEHPRGSALGFAERDQLCRQVAPEGRRVPTRSTPPIAARSRITSPNDLRRYLSRASC